MIISLYIYTFNDIEESYKKYSWSLKMMKVSHNLDLHLTKSSCTKYILFQLTLIYVSDIQ